MPTLIYHDPDGRQEIFLLRGEPLEDARLAYTVDVDFSEIMTPKGQRYLTRKDISELLRERHKTSVRDAYETQKALETFP